MNSATFVSLERRSTTGAVVEAIQNMILERKLQPGDALPSERELAALLSVSRNVLREALGILGQRGLVDSRHGAGTYVCLPSSRQARDALVLMLEVGRVRLVELCDARIIIESELACLAACRIDDKGRTALRSAWQALMEAADGEQHVAADLAFHGVIAVLADHAVLRALVDAVREPVLRGMVLGTRVPRAIQDSDRQHRAIMDAILAGDGEAARREMRDHLLFVRSYLADQETHSPEPARSGAKERRPSPSRDAGARAPRRASRSR